MTTEHPITPPNELVNQWRDNTNKDFKTILTEAARWGADQELEACCEWLDEGCYNPYYIPKQLRAARRPKSLKERALQALDLLKADATTHGLSFDSSTIRRAIESLPD